MRRFGDSDYAYAQRLGAPPPPPHWRVVMVEVLPEPERLVNHRVRMIKAFREVTGYGLKESKELCDAVFDGKAVVVGDVTHDMRHHADLQELAHYCKLMYHPREGELERPVNLGWRRTGQAALMELSMSKLLALADQRGIRIEGHWPRDRIIMELTRDR